MTGDRGATAEELDEVLTWSLVRASRIAGQRLAQRLAVHDLNPVQFGVLAHLVLAPDMTQADLARAVLLRPQSIAPLLDGLQERGLVRRSGDRVRGRRNPVQVTEDGQRSLDAAWRVALSANDLSDAGLTAGESVELNRLLLKIIGAAHGADRDDPDGH